MEKIKWDVRSIRKAIKKGGCACNGQSWLVDGKWTVSSAIVGLDGCCKCFAEKFVTIDLNPEEPEIFPKSVASITVQRVKESQASKNLKYVLLTSMMIS